VADLERCRSCNRPMRMLLTGSVRSGFPVRMPVDPDPTGKSVGCVRTGTGNLRMLPGGLEVRVLRKDEYYDGDLYTPHWGTCPDARRWTREGRKADAEAAAEIRKKLREGL
jgi:hypothetical protein